MNVIHAPNHLNIYNMNFRGRLIIAAVIAIFAIVSYFMKTDVNPVTGEKQRVSLSVKQEINLGLQSRHEMIKQFGGLHPDDKIKQYVSRVGERIVRSTEASGSPYRFDFHLLADNETVNAFALPGGQIFITYGLLKKLKTEDQLAAVLGHEIAHVINRHSAEHIAKQELTQGLIQATDIATCEPGMLSRFVASMINMKYGRDDEHESDTYGVKYLIESGYRPEAMIELMEILQSSNGRSAPEFMSTHPSPENRIQKIREAINKYKKR
jgi:predicted Zn-dependent protease